MRRVALIVILLAVWLSGVAHAEGNWVLWEQYTHFPGSDTDKGWQVQSAYPTYEMCTAKKKAEFDHMSEGRWLVNGKEGKYWNDPVHDSVDAMWPSSDGGIAYAKHWEWKCLPDTIDLRK